MPASNNILQFKTVEYDTANNEIIILDQTCLPTKEIYRRLRTVEDVYQAITTMQVRGAPLIGVVAAYGVALAGNSKDIEKTMRAAQYLKTARPTAVNLAWAINRMIRILKRPTNASYQDLVKEANFIEDEDKKACRLIGMHGAKFIQDNAKIMVHCNAGALATSGIGTALGIIYTARKKGIKFVVYSGETRPLLQGARLTSWELTKNNIPTYVICDNMAASFMDKIDLVLVGADRIAVNGDTANKIGTKGLAIIARYYNKPFYVAAPLSTFDVKCQSGSDIPVEIRDENELRKFNNITVVAPTAKICNPAFDITPAEFLSGIITECGIINPPFRENIKKLVNSKSC